MDVFYAVGVRDVQGNLVFIKQELWGDPVEPALDLSFHPDNRVQPREYIGICWYDDLVWTAFTGNSETEPEEQHKGVIWSSLIDWSE